MTEQLDPQTITDRARIEEFLAGAPHGIGGLNKKLGVEITEMSAQRVVGTMPVDGNTQPYGLLHGGASVALAETLGSIGSALHARPLGKIAVGVDINATHHRAATSGTVTGVATAAHLGRSAATYEIVITDDQGRRVCTSRITCSLVDAGRFA
ncbi:MAG: hotdog fold thioesterase [Nocardioides sp.]|nr:hotdog fold thioesterase [Nocardioides sp.]